MRVSSAETARVLLQSMDNQYAEYSSVAEEEATGSTINQPSDDPIGYARVSNLTLQQNQLTQYISNISTTTSLLDSSETEMSSMTDVIGSIRDLVVEAANDSNDSSDYSSIATQISSLKDTLVTLFNSKDSNGNYLFSGSKSSTAPLTYDSSTGSYSYNGDDYSNEVVVADGTTVASNTLLSSVFFSSSSSSSTSSSSSFFDSLDSLVSALEDGDNSTASDFLNTIDDTSSALSSAVATVGSRENELSTLSSAHSETLTYSENLSNSISESDYASTTVEAEQLLTSLQITQEVFSKVESLSLFNDISTSS